ncbi:hypothetical protein [Thiothrix unzii]|nr:hypothetical protein [Thiothrix unzii]MDX9989534.1 hypothetical protein [Thiothrix unzii]
MAVTLCDAATGLQWAAEMAILNANYIMPLLFVKISIQLEKKRWQVAM